MISISAFSGPFGLRLRLYAYSSGPEPQVKPEIKLRLFTSCADILRLQRSISLARLVPIIFGNVYELQPSGA